MKSIRFFLFAQCIVLFAIGITTTKAQTFSIPNNSLLLEFGIVLGEEDGQLKIASVLPLDKEATNGVTFKGDEIILSLNGKSVKTLDAWNKIYQELKDGDEFSIEVSSGGKKSTYKSKRKISEGIIALPASGNGGPIQLGNPSSGSSGTKRMAVRPIQGLPGLIFNEEEGKIRFYGTMNFNGVEPVKADFKNNDLILGLDGTFIKSIEELQKLVDKAESGKTLRFAIERDSERMFVNVTKP